MMHLDESRTMSRHLGSGGPNSALLKARRSCRLSQVESSDVPLPLGHPMHDGPFVPITHWQRTAVSCPLCGACVARVHEEQSAKREQSWSCKSAASNNRRPIWSDALYPSGMDGLRTHLWHTN